MALRLINGAEFLHIPKTGGTWVETVLEANNLVADYFGQRHADYDYSLLQPALTGRQHLGEAARLAWGRFARSSNLDPGQSTNPIFRFCFVRHPLTWYESWWKFMKGRGWSEWGTIGSRDDWHPCLAINGLASDDFNQFVRNVIGARPGFVSELLFSYTKPGISFIGKTETLREDLIRVLDLLQLEYSKETIEVSPKANVSKTDKKEVCWDPELKELVTRLELPALLHFGYLSAAERSRLGITQEIVPNPVLSKAHNNA